MSTEGPNGGASHSNDKTNALASLLNKLDLPTIGIIMLMGGGNWFTTKETGRLTQEEAHRVTEEVHQLYNALSGFEARQKETVEKVTKTLDNQAIELRNQAQLLQNQERMLTYVYRAQQNFKNPEP